MCSGSECALRSRSPAVGLGVASLILSGGYVEDMLVQLREATIHSQLGHLQIYKTGQYASGGQRPFDYLIDDAPEVEKALGGVPGVVTQARRLSFSGLIGNGRGELPMLGEGIQPESEGPHRHGGDDARGAPVIGRRSIWDRRRRGTGQRAQAQGRDSVDLVLSTRDGAMNTSSSTSRAYSAACRRNTTRGRCRFP